MTPIITLFGEPGAGTSTTLKVLVGQYHDMGISGGEIFRAEARKMFPLETSTESLRKYLKHAESSNGDIDRKNDGKLTEWMEEKAKHRHAIQATVEGRLVWWLCRENKIPSLNVLLFCDPNVRAERVAVRDNISKDQAFNSLALRISNDVDRYYKIYGVAGILNIHNFHVAVDTGTYSPTDTAEIIKRAYKRLIGHPRR